MNALEKRFKNSIKSNDEDQCLSALIAIADYSPQLLYAMLPSLGSTNGGKILWRLLYESYSDRFVTIDKQYVFTCLFYLIQDKKYLKEFRTHLFIPKSHSNRDTAYKCIMSKVVTDFRLFLNLTNKDLRMLKIGKLTKPITPNLIYPYFNQLDSVLVPKTIDNLLKYTLDELSLPKFIK